MAENSDEPYDTIIKIVSSDTLVSRGIINYKDKLHRELAVEGDDLLNLFIEKIDEEIFLDPPEGLTPEQITIWNDENYGVVFSRDLDYARTHGYCVLQFYKGKPEWRLFSERDRTAWIKEADTGTVIGIKVHYGKVTEEELIFGKEQCYLYKFREGDNKTIFSYSDISYAIWKIATKTREVQFQIDTMGCKPEFIHVMYGNPTPTQRTAILNALDDASVLAGIAATEQALKEINIIKHESFTELMDIVKEKKRTFSGITRLPLAFYNGERESGSGTGGAAENVVELKIEKKKQILFKNIIPLINEVYLDRHKITLGEIKLKEIEVEPITKNPNENDDPQVDKITSAKT